MAKVILLLLERLIALSMLLSGLAVGYMTLKHDIPLGLMVVLGQIHTLMNHRNHSAEEAGHLVVHKKL